LLPEDVQAAALPQALPSTDVQAEDVLPAADLRAEDLPSADVQAEVLRAGDLQAAPRRDAPLPPRCPQGGPEVLRAVL
jgi:hypothetical protein